MSVPAPVGTPLAKPELRALEQFIYREVRCIDERRWDDWLALFLDDADYWVPLTAEQSDPWEHLSVMYESKVMLQLRCRRYSHSRAHSQTPPSRTSHLVSNVMLDDYDDTTGTCVATAQFQMRDFRNDSRIDWAGTFTYDLAPVDGEFRIKRKKVLLVDSEGNLETIQIPF